jgi:hypothetical protein
MQLEGQGKMGGIWDDPPNWTMPCKGLQVPVLHSTVLELSWMKMHVEHCQHAKGPVKACQVLFYM